MEKILIVNVNWLGDAVLTTPAFKALKANNLSSYIACLCVQRVKGVFENNPYIDEIIVFDEKGQQRDLISKIKFIVYLRKKRFDKVFLIHRSFTRALICYLAGIKQRIGYFRAKNNFIVNRKIRKPDNLAHRQDHYLYLFSSSGVVFDDKIPQVFISKEAQKKASKILNSIFNGFDLLIGINPSANWILKRWPASNFAKLADRLALEFKAAIIFVGADKDKVVVDKVSRQMKQSFYDFSGKTSLDELGALMQRMDIFISNDSGPAHLAAALGIKTLAIFGPTSPEVTSPLGKSVQIIKKDVGCKLPCYNLNCSKNICLLNLSPDEVYVKVKEMLFNV